MGVNGLWQLLAPVARPVALETLSGRRFAIDASIWLYQFQMTMRDKKTGDPLKGAHIMGTFRRIMKLLYHGIKPVFVFDGDAPMLKKRTIAERKRRKTGAARDHAKTAQQLLSAQLRAAAADHALKQRQRQDEKEKARARNVETGDVIGPDAVYLEDLDADIDYNPRRNLSASAPAPSPSRSPSQPNVLPAPSPIKKYVPKDQYALPILDTTLAARAKPADPRIATEAELRSFIDDMRPEDFDIDSDFFGNLPVEIKYEIIGDLRIKSRQVNHQRVMAMKSSRTPLDFSKAQITNLMERNALTHKLLHVSGILGEGVTIVPTRVVGERNREYVLVKQNADKGGGWVLGVRDPQIGNQEPITINDSSDESVQGGTDSDDFEEVEMSQARRHRSASIDQETRRVLAIEAIRARYAPAEAAPDLDPYLDAPAPAIKRSGNTLFNGHRSGQRSVEPEEDDSELEAAVYESSMLAAMQKSLEAGSKPSHSSSRGGAATGGSGLSAAEKKSLAASRPAPVPPVTNRRAEEDDSDDSLEYVDVMSKSTASATATVDGEDSDDSMDFEEVVASVTSQKTESQARPVVAARRLVSPPAHRPSPAPLHDTRPTPIDRFPSPPADIDQEPAYVPEPTLFDSFLRADSDDSDIEMPVPTKLRSQPLKPPSPPEPDVIVKDLARESSFEPIGPPRPSFKRSEARDAMQIPQDLLFSTAGATPRIKSSIPIAPTMSIMVAAEAPRAAPTMLANKGKARAIAQENELVPDKAVNAVLDEMAEEAADEVADGVMGSEKAGERKTEADGKEDEEEFFEWEASPSPPPRHRDEMPLFQPNEDDSGEVDREEDYSDGLDWDDEETLRNLEREEDQYANMLSQLTNRRLDDIRLEAQGDVAKLQKQRNIDQRNADGITKSMANDIKDLLALFGIPFIDAPSEAEAECAELMSRQLVDGIVTDDSDVFLFGGSRIYRNMFNDNKYVECYLLTDLERELGLDRGALVRLAYLLGGDYTDGIPGVGPVLGRELLEEFRGEEGLRDFKEWWFRVQNGKDTEEDNQTAWRRKFKKGHRNLIIDDDWPNPAIARAYFKPKVNTDDEGFSWAGPDLDGLRTYLNSQLSWAAHKTDELMLPLIKRQNERKNGQIKIQGSLADYFDISAGSGPLGPRQKRAGYASERLQNVVQSWRKSQKKVEPAEKLEGEEEAAPPPKKKRAAPKAKAAPTTKAASAPKKPKRAPPKKAKKVSNEDEDDSISSEEEVMPASKRPRPQRKTAHKRSYQMAVVSDLSDSEPVSKKSRTSGEDGEEDADLE